MLNTSILEGVTEVMMMVILRMIRLDKNSTETAASLLASLIKVSQLRVIHLSETVHSLWILAYHRLPEFDLWVISSCSNLWLESPTW